jgi:hypothetical protein
MASPFSPTSSWKTLRKEHPTKQHMSLSAVSVMLLTHHNLASCTEENKGIP